MKKFFITIAFVAIAFFADAQVFIAGGLGVNYVKDPISSTVSGATKGTSFSISPTIGHMFTEKSGVGISFSFDYVNYAVYMGEADVSLFNIAPFFRQVFASVKDFSFYIDTKFSLLFGTQKSTGNDDQDIFGYGIGIIPGMSYRLADHFALFTGINILSFGYEQIKVGEDTKTTIGFGINQTTPVNLGIVYIF